MESYLEFHLPGCVKKDGEWYISSCPPLDVFSQGRTEDEAMSNLTEALVEFFASCYERGTLNAVLREAGINPAPDRHAWQHADEVCPPEAGVFKALRIPLPFIIAERHREQAAQH